MDHVPIVDDVQRARGFDAAAIGDAYARQGQHRRAAEEALQPVIIQPHPQPVANQARRHGIEDVAQQEAAVAGDKDHRILVVGGAARRQGPQFRPFDGERIAAGGVGAADHLGDKAAIRDQIGELTAAAQQESLGKRVFEVGVAGFNGPVLVGDPGVVARRRHAVVRAQRLVAPGLVLERVAVEVAERCREAVAAMLERYAAKRPQRVLQPLGQGDEALAADHDLGMAPAAECQAEVVEPMRKGLAGDGDAEFGGVGEVRQSLLTRRMLLAEDDLLLRPVQRLPVADTALEGAADAVGELGMSAQQLAQDGYRAQAGCGLQHRHDLTLPNRRERIGPPAGAGLVLLRG